MSNRMSDPEQSELTQLALERAITDEVPKWEEVLARSQTEHEWLFDTETECDLGNMLTDAIELARSLHKQLLSQRHVSADVQSEALMLLKMLDYRYLDKDEPQILIDVAGFNEVMTAFLIRVSKREKGAKATARPEAAEVEQ